MIRVDSPYQFMSTLIGSICTSQLLLLSLNSTHLIGYTGTSHSAAELFRTHASHMLSHFVTPSCSIHFVFIFDQLCNKVVYVRSHASTASTGQLIVASWWLLHVWGYRGGRVVAPVGWGSGCCMLHPTSRSRVGTPTTFRPDPLNTFSRVWRTSSSQSHWLKRRTITACW